MNMCLILLTIVLFYFLVICETVIWNTYSVSRSRLYLGRSGDPMRNQLAHRPPIRKQCKWKPIGNRLDVEVRVSVGEFEAFPGPEAI
jgi:hypothetical protein